MSVFTQLFLLVIYLSMLADGALNKKNNKKLRHLSQVRQRDIFPNSTENTLCPSLNASSSSKALLSSGFATGSRQFVIPSGTASSYGSSRLVPYPTEGAPYKNSTSPYTEQGNGEGENGQSGSGDQCPSQQTVTLPPQTITLPAQTVTITPPPETITITPMVQTETTTITVTPQVQTTTVTVWMTITANQAPSCPSPGSNANSQVAPVAPVAAPNVQPSNTPIPPLVSNASTPPVEPPIVTTPNSVIPLSPIDTIPIANATSPVIPNSGPTTTTEPIIYPVNNQTSPVAQQISSPPILPIITSTPIKAPYPYRNTTNQTLPFGSGSSRGFRPTGSGFAKPSNKPLYVPGNMPPSWANGTYPPTTAGPTAPPSPTMEYFPDDGSSLLVPPGQANGTKVLPMGGPTAPITTPAVTGTSQSLYMVVGSGNNTPPHPPPSPPPPSPPLSMPNSSTAQPLINSTTPLCNNGTTAKDMVTNVRSSPSIFLFHLTLVTRKQNPTNTTPNPPVRRTPTHTL